MISLMMSMLSLIWSFLTATKLHIVLIAQGLLLAFDVSPFWYEKIMIGVGIIWLILIISPIIGAVRNLLGK